MEEAMTIYETHCIVGYYELVNDYAVLVTPRAKYQLRIFGGCLLHKLDYNEHSSSPVLNGAIIVDRASTFQGFHRRFVINL